MKSKLLLILSCLLIPISQVFTQEKTEADTTSKASVTLELLTLEELLKIGIISSTKFEQKIIETPNVISLITSRQVEQNGWQSLNDVLLRLPSFTPSKDYERSTLSSRGLYEGWNNNHILFLFDGIPMNDNLYGTFYSWEITPLSMVKNIEVIRGPGSALYGSNAMNGVVQINTLSAGDLVNPQKVFFKIGNYGQKQYGFLSSFEAPLISSIFSFAHNETDGNEYTTYDGSGELDSRGNPKQFALRDSRESNYFWIKLNGRESLSEFSFQYHYQSWNFQTGHGWLWNIPDFDESMSENRHIFALKYNPFVSTELFPEFLIKYQVHNINWNMRYYRNGAFAGTYPAGMWEYLNTSANDVFLRAQLNYVPTSDLSLLGGIEADLFSYVGDNSHYSNVDLDNTFLPYDASNSSRELGPWLDFIKGNPVTSIGVFAQLSVKNFLLQQLNLTLGLRYDMEFFKYRDIYSSGMPEVSKDFSQLNPRIAFVYQAADNLAFKALWGKAFRAPSPTEMFGAHTFTLASNIKQLKPESLSTFEFAFDWVATSNFNWKGNVFYTKCENQIAYSAQNNNLSTNIYTLSNWGIESELLYGFSNVTGFLNMAYVNRIDEEIQDNTIKSSDKLTWYPPFLLNFGLTYSVNKFMFTLNAHYQSAVARRGNETGTQAIPLSGGVTLNMDKYRPTEVESWMTLDLNIIYKISGNLKLNADINNILDKEYYLLKNNSFPFDYMQMGRNFQIGLDLEL